MIDHLVHALHADDVLIDHVEKDRVDELADELRRRWITANAGVARFIGSALIAGRHRENTTCAEVNGRRKGSRQTNAAIAVPPIADVNRRENEWKGRRCQNVFDCQFARHVSTLSSFKNFEIASLNPAHTLTSRVIESDERNRLQPAFREIFAYAANRGAMNRAVEQLAQKRRQGIRIEQAMRLAADKAWYHAMQGGTKGNESRVVRAENVMAFECAPEVGQVLDFFRQWARFGGQEHCVDCAGRDPCDDLKLQIGEMFGDASQEADLIGRSGPAAGEHDGEVAAVVIDPIRNWSKLRYSHQSSAISKKLPTDDLRVMQGTI